MKLNGIFHQSSIVRRDRRHDEDDDALRMARLLIRRTVMMNSEHGFDEGVVGFNSIRKSKSHSR